MDSERRLRFFHPYSPYDIQLQFMQALYDCVEAGKVGIFESPTGTGKSLSLICASLTWLRDHKRKAFVNSIDQSSVDDDEPDWMLEFSRQEKTKAVTEKWRELERRLAKVRREKEKAEASHDPWRSRKKQKTDPGAANVEADESTFELDEYESDTETGKRPSGHKYGDVEGLSASTVAMLERFRGHALGRKDDNDDDDEADNQTKIFYCSRTHSQLSQFAQELRKVNFPSSLPLPPGGDDKEKREELEEIVKHLSLGSRKQLCINPKVAGLGDSVAINERCMELQQPGTAADKKCRYLPSKETEHVVSEFRDRALATVQDIEDIGQLGKQLAVCPYYATRPVVKQSEIITLPYQLLLQRSAREALDLSLKDHVVIIDEAHNLMDTISGIHSVSVTLHQLRTALFQLTTYARKYQTRLKGKNRVYVTQVIRLISSLADNLQSLAQKHASPEAIVQYSELVAGKAVDQINTYKLSRYLQESKLARKVDGYIDHTEQKKGASQPREKKTMPVLFQVQSFILSLMNPSSEGRLFFSKTDDGVLLKYLLLDPTNHFREIVDEARAVILAGGTMSPMSDYSDYLFSYVQPDKLETFSFGHVIPSGNLTARILANGGSLNSDFNFTFDKRNSDSMITDLGQTVASLCAVIPDGIVAFFPSYDYLNQVLEKWKKPPKNGREPSVFSQIEKQKTIFYESSRKESSSSTADDIFEQYSTKVESGSGALLLSVVGGRLSEGINFSDKLGRGVLIIGLPFPNIHSAVWKAKIDHIEKRAMEKGQGTTVAKAAGRDFYENSCMRAVNQCIGRAIRHRNDYAAIVMIDRRYESDRIQRKLPAWIRQSLVTDANAKGLRSVQDDLKAFFRGHDKQKVY
ncbi:chromosome transmission fidelity protein 1 [Talaromyces islandicus]|uniref:ATP-dependent DNA helicase CHL1 n=1 Tax=Talaromyces islandicus TaxID=28573 RepID=A0A0U1LJY2_TALIS|nr:chromosome transmission fidelity protein 1 [Talaromyces islandicus]